MKPYLTPGCLQLTFIWLYNWHYLTFNSALSDLHLTSLPDLSIWLWPSIRLYALYLTSLSNYIPSTRLYTLYLASLSDLSDLSIWHLYLTSLSDLSIWLLYLTLHDLTSQSYLTIWHLYMTSLSDLSSWPPYLLHLFSFWPTFTSV